MSEQNKDKANSYPPGWNDPPTTLFGARQVDSDVDMSDILISSSASVSKYLEKLSAITDLSSMHNRMLDDAKRKLGPLLDISSKNGKVSKTLGGQVSIKLLQDYINAVNVKDFVQASKVVSELMKGGFSNGSEGNAWILGLKRLIELIKSTGVSLDQ